LPGRIRLQGVGESENEIHGGARALERERAPDAFGMVACVFEGVQGGAVEELDPGQIERHPLRVPIQC
jgi:hypothetical protein